jgi:hypothetical protein
MGDYVQRKAFDGYGFMYSSMRISIFFVIGMLFGCASPHTEEKQESMREAKIYVPRDIKDTEYKKLNVEWGDVSPDRRTMNYKISVTTTFDEFTQNEKITNTRQNENPELMTSWPVYLLVYPLLNCIGSDSHCISEKKGEWKGTTEKVGSPVATGEVLDKELPLQIEHAGHVTVTGYNKNGASVGSFSSNVNLRAENPLSVNNMLKEFKSRPDHFTLTGSFITGKGKEAFTLSGDSAMLAKFDFGEYPWKSRAEIARIEQEKQRIESKKKLEEARQAKLADENRKKDELRRSKLAASNVKNDVNQRNVAPHQKDIVASQLKEQQAAQQLLEQQQLAIELEREDAEARRRESNKSAGFWGAAMGIATGNKNMAAAYLDQGFSGEDNSAAVNSAMHQDVADYRRAKAEERQRQADALKQQAEANRLQIEENNRRTAAYNQQQANAYKQQQDQTRQQLEEQRQQQADQRQQKIAQEQQRKDQARANAGANACIFPHDQNGHRYLFNHCDTTVNVRWDDAQGGHSAVLYPGSRWNSATRVEGAWTASACVEPYHPRVEGGCF